MDSLPHSPRKPRPRGARHTSKLPPSDRPIPETFGSFKSHDGTQIFYAVEGQGEPLIFCYGLVCSSLHWTYQIDHFKHTHQSVWFDYRGHHNSEHPADLSTITIENFSGDLACLLDHLKIDRAVLLGHSMGVSVALDFAHRFPDRVKALVLANGTAQRPLETLLHNPNLLPLGFELLHRLYRFSPHLFLKLWNLQKGNPVARALVRMSGFNPHLAAKEDIERYVAQIEEMDPGVLLQVLQSYQSFDASPWLHTLSAPTLIIAGDQDLVTPPAQQKLLQQLIPGSHYLEILHGSHCPQMDQPELVSARIEDFLKRLK